MSLHAVPAPAPGPLTITLPDPAISRPRRVPPGYTAPAPSDCPNCGGRIEPADRIRKVHSSWMHAECAQDVIGSMGTADLWLMLAEHVAATPSAFKASEIRAIVSAVVRIAEREPYDLDASPSPSLRGGETA